MKRLSIFFGLILIVSSAYHLKKIKHTYVMYALSNTSGNLRG